MKLKWVYGCVFSLWVCTLASSQQSQLDNYSGDFWARPALTGDWGGLRNTLSTKGINSAAMRTRLRTILRRSL